MKIAHVVLSKGFGGAERYCVDLARAQAARGHPVQVICHRDFVQRGTLERSDGLEVAPVAVRGAWDPWARRELERILTQFGPDIVHAHLARGAHLGGTASRRAGLPVTVKIHNYVKLKYYRAIDTFITTTEDQRRYLIDEGVEPDRITVIPNFSPLAAAPPWRAHDRPLVFLALGRLVAKKGFDLLLEAFARYRAQGGGGRLHLGGDGPERARLELLRRRLGLGAAVALTGWVDDVARFLAGGDVFVLPSLDEPFGIVLLEAMAAGRPIITTDTQGPREILTPDEAMIVPREGVAALTRALLEADRDRAGAERRAQAAAARFRAQYSADVVVPAIEQHYRNTILGVGPRQSVGN